MDYDEIHGIELRGGESVAVYACPCGDCRNIIMKVTDERGVTVRLDLSLCEYGHLVGEMVRLAEAMVRPDERCPGTSGTTDDDRTADRDVETS